jgi:hypothetical protein
LKKATKPLSLDLRAGGYLVYPVVQAFQLKSNIWTPSALALQSGLTEPLAAWAADVFFRLGCIKTRYLRKEYFSYTPTDACVHPRNFVPRLTPDKIDGIIERVIRNAERLNADDIRSFTVESLGILGSVLEGASEPGDVDFVFTAQWRDSGEPLPEHSYHPLGGQEPTALVARALSRGSRRMDLNLHYLLEVEAIASPYRIIWTRAEGRVRRRVIRPPKPADYEDPDGRELERTNSLVNPSAQNVRR